MEFITLLHHKFSFLCSPGQRQTYCWWLRFRRVQANFSSKHGGMCFLVWQTCSVESAVNVSTPFSLISEQKPINDAAKWFPFYFHCLLIFAWCSWCLPPSIDSRATWLLKKGWSWLSETIVQDFSGVPSSIFDLAHFKTEKLSKPSM